MRDHTHTPKLLDLILEHRVEAGDEELVLQTKMRNERGEEQSETKINLLNRNDRPLARTVTQPACFLRTLERYTVELTLVDKVLSVQYECVQKRSREPSARAYMKDTTW